MDVRNIYVSSAQRWIKYYDNARKWNTIPYINKHGVVNQTCGSLINNSKQFMIPMTSSSTANKASTNSSKMMVNMVSPAEQTVQMAEKQLKNNPEELIKRKRRSSKAHYSKRRRRTRTGKKINHKKLKKNKLKSKIKKNKLKPKIKKKYSKSKIPKTKPKQKRTIKPNRRVIPLRDILN